MSIKARTTKQLKETIHDLKLEIEAIKKKTQNEGILEMEKSGKASRGYSHCKQNLKVGKKESQVLKI